MSTTINQLRIFGFRRSWDPRIDYSDVFPPSSYLPDQVVRQIRALHATFLSKMNSFAVDKPLYLAFPTGAENEQGEREQFTVVMELKRVKPAEADRNIIVLSAAAVPTTSLQEANLDPVELIGAINWEDVQTFNKQMNILPQPFPRRKGAEHFAAMQFRSDRRLIEQGDIEVQGLNELEVMSQMLRLSQRAYEQTAAIGLPVDLHQIIPFDFAITVRDRRAYASGSSYQDVPNLISKIIADVKSSELPQENRIYLYTLCMNLFDANEVCNVNRATDPGTIQLNLDRMTKCYHRLKRQAKRDKMPENFLTQLDIWFNHLLAYRESELQNAIDKRTQKIIIIVAIALVVIAVVAAAFIVVPRLIGNDDSSQSSDTSGASSSAGALPANLLFFLDRSDKSYPSVSDLQSAVDDETIKQSHIQVVGICLSRKEYTLDKGLAHGQPGLTIKLLTPTIAKKYEVDTADLPTVLFAGASDDNHATLKRWDGVTPELTDIETAVNDYEDQNN